MNRSLFLFGLFIFSTAALVAFNNPEPTLTVKGEVKSEKKITFSELLKFKTETIGDVLITNHKGEAKGTAKGLKGIRLRDLLEQVTLNTDNPKLFSEYYFVCIASDGYKVVYSWNELFNAKTGDTAYIVLEKDNQSMAGSEDNILMISSQDIRTGRRYVKNLETISVGRAQ